MARKTPPMAHAHRRSERGIAALEFALMLPLLMTIFFGIVEFARFAIINQKLDKLVHSMADFTTQGTTISTQELATFSNTATQIMSPFGFTGTIVFSSVVNDTGSAAPCNGRNVPCVRWQAACLGTTASRMGASGSLPGNPAFPLVGMSASQNVIVAEIIYSFSPMAGYTGQIISSLSPQTLYKVAVYKPRQGTLTSLTSNGGGCTVR